MRRSGARTGSAAEDAPPLSLLLQPIHWLAAPVAVKHLAALLLERYDDVARSADVADGSAAASFDRLPPVHVAGVVAVVGRVPRGHVAHQLSVTGATLCATVWKGASMNLSELALEGEVGRRKAVS